MTTTAIDLFAGAGGFSEGARAAGVRVLWAGNHWETAVRVHTNNHPETQHSCQDLHQTDWKQVPAHDILMASPACQGHSDARGKDRPHHDAARSTAWAVVSCAEFHRPPVVLVENVPNFQKWVLYPAWCLAMKALGYTLGTSVLDAADVGVPQHRERVFVVGVLGKHAITVSPGRHPHVPIRDVLDVGSGTWNPVDRPGRSARTLARVQRGRAEHGHTFVMPYYGNGSGLTGRSLQRPIGTITTRDRWALVHGDRMRMLTVSEYTGAMAFPADYQLTGNRVLDIHLLGNAVPPPLAQHVIASVLHV